MVSLNETFGCDTAFSHNSPSTSLSELLSNPSLRSISNNLETCWQNFLYSIEQLMSLIRTSFTTLSYVSNTQLACIFGYVFLTIFLFFLVTYEDGGTSSAINMAKAVDLKHSFRLLFIPLSGGFGHISRCVALSRELKRKDPSIKFLFAAGGLTYDEAVHEGLPVVKVPEDAPLSWISRWFNVVGTNESVDIKFQYRQLFLTLSLIIFFRNFRKWMRLWWITKKFRPDAVIADGDFFVPIFCNHHKIPCVFVANDLVPRAPLENSKHYTFTKRIIDQLLIKSLMWSRLIIVPDNPNSVPVPEEVREKTYFTGPVLKRRQDELPSKQEVRKKLGISPDSQVILVTVSGIGVGSELLRTSTRAFKMVREAIPNVHMILKYRPVLNNDQVKGLCLGDGLTAVSFVRDMFEYIAASDLVVAHSGHTTLMEAALIGVPIITVPLPHHTEQEMNAQRMADCSAAVVIPPPDLTPERLSKEIISILTDEDKRVRMVCAGRGLVDGMGTERAAEYVFSFLKSVVSN